MNKVYSDDEILEARYKLWRKGDITWKLSPTQVRMLKFWENSNGKTTVINAGRRVGKTFFLSILAISQCLKKSKSVVKFLQPEKGQVKVNVIPVIDKIIEDCPIEIKPRYKTQESAYVFPNGSKIQLGGTDNGNYEKLRGDDAHLCLVDEAGFLKAPLKHIIRSVLAPSTMRTFGKIVLSSSTPTDPNHEFLKYMETAKYRNNFFAVTTKECLEEHIEENNELFTQDMYDHLLDDYPLGEKDEDFRRECLNEVVTDGINSVIPEFTDELSQQIVGEWKMPPFCDKYVSMDIGFKDLTVALFGFYDFENATLVIQRELVLNGPTLTTERLANDIKRIEKELWTCPLTGETDSPHLRICDNNLILINDLIRLHDLPFIPTQKDNKDAQVNNLRMELSAYKIAINPECKTLISHIRGATWNKRRDGYTRSPDSGHYDAVDALIYLVRNINKSHNPYPPGYNYRRIGSAADVFIKRRDKDIPKEHQAIGSIFKPKKKINKY